MAFSIVDLTSDRTDLIELAAVLLRDAFRRRTQDWQDLDSTREEVLASLAPEKISRVLLDDSGTVLGWVGGIAFIVGVFVGIPQIR